MASKTKAARKHVEEIRRKKFSIGGKPNPLTEDLHQAVKNLSAELYAKDVHFLMELIQNAEDNEFPKGVDPSLEFVITSKDITNTGAPATLLVFNNEKGFLAKNIDSICSVGRSTKKGLRKNGYIGEKGIGFKSVFLITSQPYIFSNGYQIRFTEKPCEHCNVGYIVPEWVEEDIKLSAIQSIYGSSAPLPNTTLVLPLKPEKVKPVKDQLSSVHPEVLLFLSKIRRLSVREDNHDPTRNTINAISISSEKNFVTSKSMDADSFTLNLMASDGVNRECGYYMWKQRFPVKQENKVDVRREVDDWVITLAFPHGERLKRGLSSPGIYSFLPTETVTNFPFIIQADFLLASSRENILWDNKWNQGILDCIPVAFVNAFTSLLKSVENAPVSNLPNMFLFLPVEKSSHQKLNNVRDAIKEKMMNATIVPCESYTTKKVFRKPNEVGKLKPAFLSIMNKAESQGVSFVNMSSHGTYFLVSSFNKSEYKAVLNFLEIKYVDYDWYAKCIGSSNLVKDVSEDVYVQLLVFIAEKWKKYFYSTNIKNTPLIKYLGLDNQVYVYTPFSATSMLMAVEVGDISWLIKWNTEFGCATGKHFLPQNTQNSIKSCSKLPMLLKWLKVELKVEYLNVSQYAAKLLHYSSVVNTDRKLAVTFAHFLHRSLQKKHLNEGVVTDLCKKMPIVDNYGHIYKTRSGVLVPSKGSKWVELLGANPWRQHNYIELGEDYTRSVTYFGETTSGQKLVEFLDEYVKPSDVPNLSPPNAAIPTLSSPLTKKNTFLLLGWLCSLKALGNNIPENFLSSIKHGSWLKVLLSGSSGYSPPSESFMLDSSLGKLLQNGSVIVDIPLVNEKFYGDEIKNYREGLRTIGVRFENEEVCEYIGKRFMSLAASSNLTRDDVLSMLKFIRYLGADSGTDSLVKSMREEKWVKTSRGDMTPGNSVLFSDEWNAASQISDIPFIDQDYYGNELLSFKGELERLGVTLNFNGSYQLVLDNLKFRAAFGCMSSEAMLFVLTCIQKVDSSDKLVEELKHTNCLKTKLGYKFPYECFLLNPESVWGCLLHVFGSFPVLDEEFYGKSIFSMSHELKKIGVKVDFENSSTELIRIFKQQVSLSSINKEHVLSFLECYRKLKTHDFKFSTDFQECIFKEKWIRTRLGDFRSPNECILFGKDWKSISKISVMPFIDDINFYGNEIHDYRKELKELGVVTDFKEGAKFVADGLSLPQHSSSLTIANVFALLDCVKRLEEKEKKIPVKFLEKLSEKNWLKTHFGYKRTNECLLFDSSWDSLLKRNDGPFINEGFYGSRIGSYKNELKILGVITDTNKQCQLLAGYLKCHSNFETISRIYNYLSTFKWEPVDEENKRIWIPKGAGKGVWVMPQDCVLHDKNNLFGELNVLKNCNYDNEILDFFANTFKVKIHPSVDDYCKLWKTWESSGQNITIEECCAFWEFAVHNWYPRTEDTFKNNLLKLPVLDPYSNGIILSDKRDVFIGDDLFLTDLFQSCSRPIFVWFPQPGLRSLNRSELVDIYTRLGVRTLTASAQKIISDVGHAEFKPVNTKEKIIKKGLVKLILGSLADPNLKFELEKRHEAVSRILAIEAFERPEKMTVRYTLSLSSGDVVDVEPRRMVRWDKQQSKLYMQKMEGSSSEKQVMEFAFHFAEEIAEGMLWENEELVPGLSELIRSGYMVKFEEEAIDFLMKMKNMQILVEDHDYLSSAFSSSNGKLQEISSASPSPSSKSSPGQLFTGKKRRGNNSIMASFSSYELRSSKRRKQTDTVSVTGADLY